jgi:hypothetical protein
VLEVVHEGLKDREMAGLFRKAVKFLALALSMLLVVFAIVQSATVFSATGNLPQHGTIRHSDSPTNSPVLEDGSGARSAWQK